MTFMRRSSQPWFHVRITQNSQKALDGHQANKIQISRIFTLCLEPSRCQRN